jgi:glycosyltransferase involved in cell wall biosynthesis
MVTAFPADPQAPRGGVEAVSVNLAHGLCALPDVQLHVVTIDPACTEAREERCNGMTVHRLPRTGRRVLLEALGSGRRQVRRRLEDIRPDVVHAHDVYGLMVKGLDLARVFTIHGFIYGDTLVSGRGCAWLRAQLWKRIETAGWADQPHIISISPYVRERLGGIARGVIHDIENPIAEEFFRVRRSEEPGTIFSAAVISPRKNTLRLVEALHRLVQEGLDARLRLAGPVVDADYGRCVQQRIDELKLSGRVRLLGRLSSSQIRDELARACVFALVSLEENSPMGIEEAMAARVVVVTSNRCGMPYMVADGRSGFLVDPFDAADIAGRLGQVLRDGNLRRRLGERAAQAALERFHPRQVAGRTREVYERALRGHREGRTRG